MGFFQDDEEEDLPQAEPSEVSPEAEASADQVAPAPAVDRDAQIKSFLTQKYGAPEFDAAADDSAVKDAQKGASRGNMIANIGQALAGFAGAGATSNGGKAPVDTSLYSNMREDQGQKVKQAQSARDAKIKDFLSKRNMGREDVADKRAEAEFGQKQKEWGVKNVENDPNSETSAGVRATYQEMFPDVVAGLGDDFAHLSAAAIRANLTNSIELKAKMDANKEIAKSRNQQHSDAMALRSDAVNTAADKKVSESQGKAYTEMTNRIAGGRGAPQNVTQAQLAQTSVAKAKELIDQAPNGDLNKLSPQQVNLLGAEIEKIATGGVPTEAGRAGLDPQTFAAQWAAFKNKAVGPDGQVNGAELGPFIAQNKAYIEGLGKVVNGVVSKYQRDTFDDYADSGRLSEDHQAKFRKKHPELFPEEQPGARAAAGVAAAPKAAGGDGEAQAAPQAPLDPKIGDYAKAHGLDYGTAERILVNRGYKPGGK
jgi:hypothetical protein